MQGERERERAKSWKLYLAEVQPEETLDNFSILKYCAVLFASFFRRISVSEPAVPPFPFELCCAVFILPLFSAGAARFVLSAFPLSLWRPIELSTEGCVSPSILSSSRPPWTYAAWLEKILCEILSALLRGTGREYFMRCIIWPDVPRRFVEFTIVRAYAVLTFVLGLWRT